jgi:hypothetical protein
MAAGFLPFYFNIICKYGVYMRLNYVGVKAVQLLVVSFSMLLSTISMADEPVQLLEEVTVVGAVRGSSTIVIADIDVVGDESLDDMPYVYE